MSRKRAETPAAVRQKIVSYLVDHPESTAREIAEGLGYVKRTVQNYIPALCHTHAIKSTETRVGRTAVWRYTALVTTVDTEPQPKLSRERELVTHTIGNRTVHHGMSRARPLPAQGGQGGGTLPRLANCLMSMG